MPIIKRSALVEHTADRMFHLVNAIEQYSKWFAWCKQAQVLSREDNRVQARLDVQVAGFSTWFMTENILYPEHRMDMHLQDGPFRKLEGRWDFQALGESACKVALTLDFEPTSRLLGPALWLGMQGLADRMVNDFVRVADQA